MTDPVAVLKIGGSILTGPSGYHRAGAFVARRLHEGVGERILVVVSAEAGATDSLFAMARSIVEEPEANDRSHRHEPAATPDAHRRD